MHQLSDITAAGPVPNMNALLSPLPTLMGLPREATSLRRDSSEEPRKEWKLVEGLIGTAITLVQMAEGLGKSLAFLELVLRAPWQPTEEELKRAIARSEYRDTTDRNEWMEAPIVRSGRTIYIGAEGAMEMHRDRAYDILNNNMGVVDVTEQDRILSRVEFLSLRTFYHEIVASDEELKRGLRLFRQDKKSGIWEPTPLYLNIMEHIAALHRRVDEGVARLKSMDLEADILQGMIDKVEEERPVLLVIDTFGAIWGPRSTDDEGLQAVNQRANADGDKHRIAMALIAHTNKSEDVEKDDHRAAGKGAVEMHSTVENTTYGRGVNESEVKVLASKGENEDADRYLAFRIGKTNLKHVDRDTRIMKRIPSGAPVCITRKLGLTGRKIGGAIRNGYSREVIVEQILLAVELLGEVSAAGIWRKLNDSDKKFATSFPALLACAKEGSGSASDWKISALLTWLAGDGKLSVKKTGRGKIYSVKGRS